MKKIYELPQARENVANFVYMGNQEHLWITPRGKYYLECDSGMYRMSEYDVSTWVDKAIRADEKTPYGWFGVCAESEEAAAGVLSLSRYKNTKLLLKEYWRHA